MAAKARIVSAEIMRFVRGAQGMTHDERAWFVERVEPIVERAIAEQEAELSRLRDLVREMREAHINTLSIARIKWGNIDPGANTIFDQAETVLVKADAILKESGEPVKYGCHAGTAVFHACATKCCAYGVNNRIERKEDCPHWRPIK